MLAALHDAMIDKLGELGADAETVAAYKRRWRDTQEGHAKAFPCPSCFMAGTSGAELKALPARSYTRTHHVTCTACNAQYSYVEIEEEI